MRDWNGRYSLGIEYIAAFVCRLFGRQAPDHRKLQYPMELGPRTFHPIARLLSNLRFLPDLAAIFNVVELANGSVPSL